jgi:hypothetical protein
MPGYNPGLPDRNETDPVQQKYWWLYFVYGVCFWIALAMILVYAIILGAKDGTFAVAWITLFLAAVPLVALPFYLYRMYSIMRCWEQARLEKIKIEETHREP